MTSGPMPPLVLHLDGAKRQARGISSRSPWHNERDLLCSVTEWVDQIFNGNAFSEPADISYTPSRMVGL